MNQEQENLQKKNKNISINTLISSAIIIVCLVIIIYTVWEINPGRIRGFLNFIASFLKLEQVSFIFNQVRKVVWKLLSETIKAVWVPILIYVLINIFIKSRFLKILIYLAILCLFSLLASNITNFNFNQVQLNLIFFKHLINSIASSLTFILNAYFFILLLTPKVFWKIFSGAIFLIVGVVLEIIPNVPVLSQLGDISILTGLFSFLFLILHTVASLIQCSTAYLNQKIHTPKLDFSFNSAKESSDDCKDDLKEQLTNINPMNSKDAAQELE